MSKSSITAIYQEKCGSFEISQEAELDGRNTSYIYTERFIAHTLFTPETKFVHFPDDIKALYSVTFADPVVMEKYTTGNTQTIEEFETFVKLNSLRALYNYPFSAFIITDKYSDAVIGYEIISDGSKSNTGRTSYIFRKDYQNSSAKQHVGYENVGALIWGYGEKLYNGAILVNQTYNEELQQFEGGSVFNTISAGVRTDNIGSSKILGYLGFDTIRVIYKYGFERYEFELNYNNIEIDKMNLHGELPNTREL